MANMKNAKKKIKSIAKETVNNNNYAASMKTACKNVEKAVKNEIFGSYFTNKPGSYFTNDYGSFFTNKPGNFFTNFHFLS